MKPSADIVLPKVLYGAATERTTLAVAGAAAFAALLVGTWPAAGLALVAALVVLMVNAGRRKLWSRVIADVHQISPPLPCEAEFLDDESKQFLGRVALAQAERAAVLERMAAPLGPRIAPLLSAAAALEETVIPLLRRHDALHRYLDPQRASGNRHALSAAPAMMRDGSFTVASASLPPHPKTQVLDEVMDRVQIVRGQIEDIIRTLEVLPARLVRLGFDAMAPATVEADAHKSELLGELSALESSVDSLCASTATSGGGDDQAVHLSFWRSTSLSEL